MTVIVYVYDLINMTATTLDYNKICMTASAYVCNTINMTASAHDYN